MFVEITAKGLDILQNALGQVQKGLKAIEEGANRVGEVAVRSFKMATVALGGWVVAGVAASATGQLLGFQMEQLSRAIAGVFKPELNALVNLVIDATNWIRNLSDEKKELIVNLLKGAAAAAAVAVVIPRLSAVVGGAIGAVKLLTGAFIGLDVASGGILPLIGAVVTGLTAFGIGTETGRHGFMGLLGILEPIAAALTQMGEKIAKVFVPPLMAVATQLLPRLVASFAPLLPLVAGVASNWLEVLAPAMRIVVDLMAAMISLQGYLVKGFAELGTIILRLVKPIVEVLVVLLTNLAQALENLMRMVGIDVPRLNFGLAARAGAPDRSPLSPRLGGFEGIEAAWFRIAQMTILATSGRHSHEQTVENHLGTISNHTGSMSAHLARLLPATANH